MRMLSCLCHTEPFVGCKNSRPALVYVFYKLIMYLESKTLFFMVVLDRFQWTLGQIWGENIHDVMPIEITLDFADLSGTS